MVLQSRRRWVGPIKGSCSILACKGFPYSHVDYRYERSWGIFEEWVGRKGQLLGGSALDVEPRHHAMITAERSRSRDIKSQVDCICAHSEWLYICQ
jgi:hypothetical protein